MEIRKLQKRLLREELRRRRKNSKFYRLLVPATLLLLILLFGGLIWYVSGFDQRLEKDFHRAEELVAQGSYDQAVAVLTELHQEYTSHTLGREALYKVGEVRSLYQQQYAEAILAFLAVEESYPDSDMGLQAQRQVADIYKNKLRDYPRALVVYQRLLERGLNDSDRIQHEIADAYFRMNDFKQALLEYEALRSSYPDSPLQAEVRYRMGITLSLEGKGKEAEVFFREVISLWPQSPFALESKFSLATVLEERDELAAAMKVLEELKGSYPNTELLNRRLTQLRERLVNQKRIH
jgi:TolA-binding protein